MVAPTLITPTLHVEVQLATPVKGTPEYHSATRNAVAEWMQSNYATVHIGKLEGYEDMEGSDVVRAINVADYTGPYEATGYYSLTDTALDVQTYVLRSEHDTGDRRSIKHDGDEAFPQARVIALPNVMLTDDWDSLVFDDGLPSRLLRYLVRMVGMMGKPGLNIATFNWNKLCLLHGPPGSGKSTLCRALAQKLAIRLGDLFPKATLVEVNANSMLSKYFGESGKLIEAAFEKVESVAKDSSKFVVVVIDEVETIASSRQRVTSGGECNDGLRATNQLLTALDRLRSQSNILVCCTSNLIEAIDPAFLDRVDIKQHVPAPSSAAVYNIFRSCLNELIRSKLLSSTVTSMTAPASSSPSLSAQPSKDPRPVRKKRRVTTKLTPPPTDKGEVYVHVPVSPSMVVDLPLNEGETHSIPTLPSTLMDRHHDFTSHGQRVWLLAQKCQDLHLSGRTLRRLPILGLAMYTWGGEVGMSEALGALEKAVEEEVVAMKERGSKVSE